ncbi:hypothetical protein TRP8649_01404 [Pelagimonas phthalicica]|uniref:Phage tail assembly chaperone protein, E, or 41 or 14 n=1 Tax=Pelagimonas phthalicica TaxID=1037362 RepID=A0A238J9A2_9RHOB|nr:phage tail assembly protein [Pelagimonas phthalicica]TDS94174.1 tail assembly chaperone E/41/14-like protein [Pelagimonas phthalicica]SMX27301.1 hypothetical protein TRP8649_01404 [Pelagimonas phthalicica]
MSENPKWLVEGDDGSITIKFDDLKSAPEIDGTKVKVLTMREPTAQDQVTADKSAGHAGDKEISLFANLTEQSPEAIGALKIRAYSRLQAAYELFTS